MRVLDVGAGESRPGLWPEAEWVRVDLNPETGADVVADVRDLPEDLGDFDHILASHVLEHLGRYEALEAIKHWASFLKPGGSLHLIVPDLEWAAGQIAGGHPNITVPVMMVVYGGQGNPLLFHKWGYTCMSLRSVIEKAGLAVSLVRTGPFVIRLGIGTENETEAEARQIYAEAKWPTALQRKMLDVEEEMREAARCR